MKRNVLFFSLFAAVILLFASCTPEAGMTELGYDDIKASWVDGRWTGTKSITVDDNDPVVTDVDEEFTEAKVKAYWGSDVNINLGDTGVKVECNVYANLNRTKMNIVIKSKTNLLGNTSLSTTRYKLTKQ
jgi:hypothetical protein